jgi:hypothetical protein
MTNKIQNNDEKMKTKEIQWKRLFAKAAEDVLKKAIELTALAIIIGAYMKIMLVALPAVLAGGILARLIKLRFLG